MTYYTAKTFELHNGGTPYAFTENGDTLRFEVHSGDKWKYDTANKERSEISSYKLFDFGKTYQISYGFKIEKGQPNTADWLLIGQIHQTEDAGDLGTSPPFAIELVGERMRIVARTTTEATTTKQPPVQVLWTDTADIQRDHWYDMKIEVKFDPTGAGVINVVRDGVIIVQYSGATGFVDLKGSYWKEGIYRESSPETMAVDFQNLNIVESTGGSILQNAISVAKPAVVSASLDVLTAVTTTVLATGHADLTLGGVAAINGTGNELANVLRGNDAANTLNGNGGNDTLYGFGGNDVLNGGDGADVMYGGAGDDSYNVNHIGDVTVELAGEGTDTVNASIHWTLGANIENLNLVGNAALNGTGNDLANTITGNEAANVLSGGAGDDLLRGNGGDDTLWGGDGNDTLNGGAGADLMYGGRGDDVFNVDNANDKVVEYLDQGTDLVNSTVSWTLSDNVENLVLVGTAANGTGNALANSITGNESANVLWGMDGGDVLRGNGGDDVLWGGAGDDTLSGGAGKDTLHGGAGADLMNGGADADVFVFDTLSDISYGDVIQDFSSAQGDKIDLRAIDANSKIAGDQAFSYLGSAAFSGEAGQLHMVRESSGVWHVEGDLNGDRVADFSFTVYTGSALAAADFLL